MKPSIRTIIVFSVVAVAGLIVAESCEAQVVRNFFRNVNARQDARFAQARLQTHVANVQAFNACHVQRLNVQKVQVQQVHVPVVQQVQFQQVHVPVVQQAVVPQYQAVQVQKVVQPVVQKVQVQKQVTGCSAFFRY